MITKKRSSTSKILVSLYTIMLLSLTIIKVQECSFSFDNIKKKLSIYFTKKYFIQEIKINYIELQESSTLR